MLVDNERRLIVRFVSDWSMYAAGEQAAFPESHAMGLQQKGYASIVRPVEQVVPTMPPGTPPVAAAPAVAVPAVEVVEVPIVVEDKRRKH